ncbi:hypothetical protein D3C75_1040380 [compost metagenome]
MAKLDVAAAVALTTPVTCKTMLPPLAMSMLAPLAVRNWPPTISKPTPPLLVAPFWYSTPTSVMLLSWVGRLSRKLMSKAVKSLAALPLLMVIVKLTVSPWS